MVATVEETEYLKALGERLVALREAADLSQQQMAARAGLARSFYARMEGGSHNASVGTLRKVAIAHGIGLGELLAPIDG